MRIGGVLHTLWLERAVEMVGVTPTVTELDGRTGRRNGKDGRRGRGKNRGKGTRFENGWSAQGLVVKRPLAWASAALAAGSYAAAWGAASCIEAPWAACIAALALSVAVKRRRRIRDACLLAAFAALGMLLWDARHAAPPGDALSRDSVLRPKTAYVLEGRVRRPRLFLPGEDYTSFLLDVDRVCFGDDGMSIEGRVTVGWSEPGDAVYADERVRVAGVLSHQLGFVNFGIHGREDWLRRHGVHTALRIRGERAVERVEPGRWWRPDYWASRLRTFEAGRLAEAVPADVLPFVMTVWLGERGQIERHAYDDYVASGTAHILAVSGVHIGIVFASASFLLRLLIRNRRVLSLIHISEPTRPY